MSKPEKRRYVDISSQERYDRMVEKGVDPHDRERGFCHDCGYFPAFIPRVFVANRETLTTDRYLLQLPNLCNACVKKRGLTRYGYLIPKREEFQNYTQACEAFLKEHPAWIKKVQEKGIRELTDQGMSVEDARAMLGCSEPQESV